MAGDGSAVGVGEHLKNIWNDSAVAFAGPQPGAGAIPQVGGLPVPGCGLFWRLPSVGLFSAQRLAHRMVRMLSAARGYAA